MDRRRDSFNAKKPDVKDLAKLTLWNSQHFTPIMSHEELETILAKLGFIAGQILPPSLPLPGAVSWRPYIYSASCRWMKKKELQSGEKPPIVKLPYPKIDGLHELTYGAFLDALNFYLEEDDISTIFHIRSSAINSGDLPGSWEFEESETGKPYIYRSRTLDRSATPSPMIIMKNNNRIRRNQDNGDDDDDDDDNAVIRWKKRTRGSSSCSFVPLEDIITTTKNGITLKDNNNHKQLSADSQEIEIIVDS